MGSKSDVLVFFILAFDFFFGLYFGWIQFLLPSKKNTVLVDLKNIDNTRVHVFYPQTAFDVHGRRIDVFDSDDDDEEEEETTPSVPPKSAPQK